MRHAVILAGGGGTRLWPASRRAHPKQFLSLGTGHRSLLEGTAHRLAGASIWVVTAAEQVAHVRAALPDLEDAAVITEPVGRNTAAALGLAAVHLLHSDPDAVMAALPSDQHIANPEGFAQAVERAYRAAEERDAIVTIGIVPTRAETGFGYLRTGASIDDGVFAVDAFVEKPDQQTAEEYVQSGRYLWNGGMFFTRAQRLLDEITAHMPDTARGLDAIARAISHSPKEAKKVTDSVYPTLPSISIDYGVMEKTSPVYTVRGDFGWNDVGSWSALADYGAADADGNTTLGTAVAVDAKDNILVSDADRVVAVAGVEGLIVVQSGNAVLVLPKDRAQDVREIVAALRDKGLDRFL
jgi:mannose-1-phosphate guanylyltransferase